MMKINDDNQPKAFITGVTGQDGSYLARFLIHKGYNVFGMVRHISNPTYRNIEEFLLDDRFRLVAGDMTDAISLRRVLELIKPDEIYNLAAMSFVGASWDQPILTNQVNYIGFMNLLEVCRDLQELKRIKIYQASTSEMFGNVPAPQSEESPMMPRSPYGVSKLAAHRMARVFRESFDMFISCGILFNHESPRRGKKFVTRKITSNVAKIYLGLEKELRLGHLDARRDWGYAGDYVEAMWMMLQHEMPDDFVIGTGIDHSVREFADLAFKCINLDWKDYVIFDDSLMRPAEVYSLRADTRKANEVLGWRPTITFKQLVSKMVHSDIESEIRECPNGKNSN